MKNKHVITLSSILIATFAITSVSAATVKSMSREIFNDAEKPIWEVTVECDSKASQRIQQSLNGGQWRSISALCGDDKDALADRLCGGSIAGANSAPSKSIDNKLAPISIVENQPVREKFISAQIKIEEQQIQQKRLELRRQELNLQKRQADGS